jgi:hypothetical protein
VSAGSLCLPWQWWRRQSRHPPEHHGLRRGLRLLGTYYLPILSYVYYYLPGYFILRVLLFTYVLLYRGKVGHQSLRTDGPVCVVVAFGGCHFPGFLHQLFLGPCCGDKTRHGGGRHTPQNEKRVSAWLPVVKISSCGWISREDR